MRTDGLSFFRSDNRVCSSLQWPTENSSASEVADPISRWTGTLASAAEATHGRHSRSEMHFSNKRNSKILNKIFVGINSWKAKRSESVVFIWSWAAAHRPRQRSAETKTTEKRDKISWQFAQNSQAKWKICKSAAIAGDEDRSRSLALHRRSALCSCVMKCRCRWTGTTKNRKTQKHWAAAESNEQNECN